MAEPNYHIAIERHGRWTGMTPEPPREYVAFVAQHLPRLRHDAELLAGDEYEAHELYSKALADTAFRWQWFALLRRLNRPDAADAYLHETLIRRSTQRQVEQADFVEFEVWSAHDRRATYSSGQPMPLGPPARSGRPASSLPMASFGIEIGPVTEAAVAWWHAYVAHRNARLSVTTAVVAFVLVIVLPFLQRL